MSERCQILISKIFTKASDRILLKNFKNDTWFQRNKDVIKSEKKAKVTKDAPAADDKASEDTKSVQVSVDEQSEQKGESQNEDIANNNA